MPQRVKKAVQIMWTILEDKKEFLENELRRQGHQLEIELASINRTLKFCEQKNILNENDVEIAWKKLSAYFHNLADLETKFHVNYSKTFFSSKFMKLYSNSVSIFQKTNKYLLVLSLKTMDFEKMEKVKFRLTFVFGLWDLVREILKETQEWAKGGNKLFF